MLFLRSLFFAVLLPGSVTVLFPYWILSRQPPPLLPAWGLVPLASLLPMAAGAAILLRCIRDFAVVGRGTLAPVDPPKELVVQGLYRYVRNPMYVGVLLVLLSEAAFFASAALLAYAAVIFLGFHAFITQYEEPALQRQFGESYARYRRSVPRWLPRRPG
jgi:protein-S-isoprenylcysteine O-methyltransferase Ste14